MFPSPKQEYLLLQAREGNEENIFEIIKSQTPQENSATLIYTARYDTQDMVRMLLHRMPIPHIVFALLCVRAENDVAALEDLTREMTCDQKQVLTDYFLSALTASPEEKRINFKIHTSFKGFSHLTHYQALCTFHTQCQNLVLFLPSVLTHVIGEYLGGAINTVARVNSNGVKVECTPLLYAVQQSPDEIQSLLEQKADPFLWDEHLVCPFSVAMKESVTLTQQLLNYKPLNDIGVVQTLLKASRTNFFQLMLNYLTVDPCPMAKILNILEKSTLHDHVIATCHELIGNSSS